MSDYEEAQQATPFTELERQMMDVNVPKNEREWWSWREISNLRAEVERLRVITADTIARLTAEVERLRAALQDMTVEAQAQYADGVHDGAEASSLVAENEKLRAALGLWRTAYEAESLVGLSMAYDVTVPLATQEKSDDP